MKKMQADTKSFIETQCRIAGCAREAKALSKGYSVIVEGCGGSDDDIADESYDFGVGDSLDNNRAPGGSNSGGGDSLNNKAPGGSNSGGAEDDNADESYAFGSGTTLEYGE